MSHILAQRAGGRADATCERDGVSGITLLMVAANCGNERVVELEPSSAHKPLCNSSKLTQHPVVEKMTADPGDSRLRLLPLADL